MATVEAVRERPILFSGEMVRAILDGRKTVTRRVVKPQPPPGKMVWPCHYSDTGWALGEDPACVEIAGCQCDPVRCPYGEEGDRLWCRETWALVRADEDGIDDWVDMGPVPDSPPWPGWEVWYRAGHSWAYDQPDDRGFRWRPSIFMPRWASRITLRVTSVRVERLQAITEADARAEGFGTRRPTKLFRETWDKINGKGAWDKNSWVWVVGFEQEPAP